MTSEIRFNMLHGGNQPVKPSNKRLECLAASLTSM